MLTAERSAIIMQELNSGKTVQVKDLSLKLKVSVDTIRRDLKALQDQGLLKYVRGGACLPDSLRAFAAFSGREIINQELKKQACSKALGLIKEGSLIALNSGTTNTVLAELLVSFKQPLTIVTNNFAALEILMQNPCFEVIAVGGKIDGAERSSYGAQCVREFSAYIPDLAFLSINAVSNNAGFSDFRFNEIPIIKCLAQNARKVAAIMDSTKLNKVSKCKVLDLSEVDILVSDDGLEDKSLFERAGVAVL